MQEQDSFSTKYAGLTLFHFENVWKSGCEPQIWRNRKYRVDIGCVPLLRSGQKVYSTPGRGGFLENPKNVHDPEKYLEKLYDPENVAEKFKFCCLYNWDLSKSDFFPGIDRL